MEHVIYIATGSDNYYPGPGTYDWLYCGPSYDEAFAAYINSKADDNTLIGIAADGTYTALLEC